MLCDAPPPSVFYKSTGGNTHIGTCTNVKSMYVWHREICCVQLFECQSKHTNALTNRNKHLFARIVCMLFAYARRSCPSGTSIRGLSLLLFARFAYLPKVVLSTTDPYGTHNTAHNADVAPSRVTRRIEKRKVRDHGERVFTFNFQPSTDCICHKTCDTLACYRTRASRRDCRKV